MTYPTNQIPSTNPQNLAIATPVGLQSAPRDPTAQDNTFVPGSEWQNTVTKLFWKCQSSTIAGAVWVMFAGAGTGTVVSLTGNSGGAVGPDGSGNINTVGDGTTITIAGNPGTHTLTASLVGGGVASQSYVTNLNSPVVPTASGVIDLNASTSTYTDGAVANTIKIELQGTNHALFVGRGVHVPATTIATGTSGQALVSAGAGADPAFGTLGVAGGGTGDTSFTPYEVIVANTTGTGALTQVSGVGTSGQVLTSNGAAMFPTWQNPTIAAPTTGTFTPTLNFSGGNGTLAYTSSGKFWVIGPIVFYYASYSLTLLGTATGNPSLTLTGLPNMANDGASLLNSINAGNIAFTAGYTAAFAFMQANTNIVDLFQYGSNAATLALSQANYTNISGQTMTGFYWTS